MTYKPTHRTEVEIWDTAKMEAEEKVYCPCPKKRNRIKFCRTLGILPYSDNCASVIDRKKNDEK